MDVKGVKSTMVSTALDYVKKNSAEKAVPGETKGDKIELSDLAKKIKAGEVKSKDLSIIRNKITDNFYNNDSVIDTVARNILREISR